MVFQVFDMPKIGADVLNLLVGYVAGVWAAGEDEPLLCPVDDWIVSFQPVVANEDVVQAAELDNL